MRLIVFSGSLRAGSWNTALAQALATLAPDECEVDVVTPLDIPLYEATWKRSRVCRRQSSG